MQSLLYFSRPLTGRETEEEVEMKLTKADVRGAAIGIAFLVVLVWGVVGLIRLIPAEPPVRKLAERIVTEQEYRWFTAGRQTAEKFVGEWTVLRVDLTVGLGYYRTVHLVLGDNSTRVLFEVQGGFSRTEQSQLFQKVVLATPGDRVRVELKEPGQVKLSGDHFIEHLQVKFL